MHRTLVVSILTAAALAHAQSPAPPLDSDSLGVMTFANGSTRVMPGALDRIQEIAAWHVEHPDSLLILEGHASPAGSWNSNLRISQARTDAVRGALVRAGADPARMVLVAHSENDADIAEGPNRRVVIRATNAFPELAREQRDPVTGEDARAEGRAIDQQHDEGAGDDDSAAIATGGTTVVVVPGGGQPGMIVAAPAPTGIASWITDFAGRPTGGGTVVGAAAGTGASRSGEPGPAGETGGAVDGR
jgi:hypothetical protein